MNHIIEVKVPDIGDFKDVEVIEVLVAPGDQVEVDSSLITVESDKASMEIPSPAAGVVRALHVQVGDRISEGDPILSLEVADTAASSHQPVESRPAQVEAVSQPTPSEEILTEIAVLGAGPGGYTAAFRAADLGKQVVLIEREPTLGGVCLNVGCIPSKTLLHTAAVIEEVKSLANLGVTYGAPEIDLARLRASKDRVVARLTGGLAALAKQRRVRIIQGEGRFESPNRLRVETATGMVEVRFDQAIIACGSSPIRIPGFPHEDSRVMDSTDALALADIPERLLIVGGGIIGLEMAAVYSALGSRIDIVELKDQLLPGCDPDLVQVLAKVLRRRYENIWLNTRVTQMEAAPEGIRVAFAGGYQGTELYDKVLVAVGRVPNGKQINAEAAGVEVDGQGFIRVDRYQRTNIPHLYAIGDVTGGPMLAHKASHEGKVAAEVIAGLPALFDPLGIPAVAYTDPEVAWVGLTETEAKAKGIQYEKGVFPWAASGRALGLHREEGLTKLLFDPQTKRLLGAGIVGPNAGELIGEAVLALEMGADMEDIALTIHPHPTLTETLGLAAELAHGSITDLMPPRRSN